MNNLEKKVMEMLSVQLISMIKDIDNMSDSINDIKLYVDQNIDSLPELGEVTKAEFINMVDICNKLYEDSNKNIYEFRLLFDALKDNE